MVYFKEERQLKARISELQEFRENGITNMNGKRSRVMSTAANNMCTLLW